MKHKRSPASPGRVTRDATRRRKNDPFTDLVMVDAWDPLFVAHRSWSKIESGLGRGSGPAYG